LGIEHDDEIFDKDRYGIANLISLSSLIFIMFVLLHLSWYLKLEAIEDEVLILIKTKNLLFKV